MADSPAGETTSFAVKVLANENSLKWSDSEVKETLITPEGLSPAELTVSGGNWTVERYEGQEVGIVFGATPDSTFEMELTSGPANAEEGIAYQFNADGKSLNVLSAAPAGTYVFTITATPKNSNLALPAEETLTVVIKEKETPVVTINGSTDLEITHEYYLSLIHI